MRSSKPSTAFHHRRVVFGPGRCPTAIRVLPNFLSQQGFHEGSALRSLTLAVLLDESNLTNLGGLPKPALVVTGLGDRSADVPPTSPTRFAFPSNAGAGPSYPSWWEMSAGNGRPDETFRID